MNGPRVPDPWVNKREISIDDGGGESFAGGYDANTSTFTILEDFKINVSKDVGYWKVSGSLHFCVTERPSWFHRKMTKFLLGWIWVDS